MGMRTRSHGARRRGRAVGLAVATGAALALAALLGTRGIASATGATHAGGSWQEAEEVLTTQALRDFREKLPHRWHRDTTKLLRWLATVVPVLEAAASLTLAATRRELAAAGSGFVLVGEGQSGVPGEHRKWRAWLDEVCRVFGFSVEGDDAEPLGESVGPQLACPELWVDQAWPPGSLTSAPAPRGRSRELPAWSVVAPRRSGARGLIVLQAKELQAYPPREVKAILGYELGRAAWVAFAPVLPPGWGEHALQGYAALRLWHTGVRAQRQPQRRWVAALQSARLPWNLVNDPFAPFGGISAVGPVAAEWAALALVLKRLVPPLMQPLVLVGLVTKGPEVHEALRSLLGLLGHTGRTQKSGLANLRLPLLGAAAPWAWLLGEAAAAELLALLGGSRSRAMAVTMDRIAALAAGDAHAAAAAVLRARGLLSPKTVLTPADLDEALARAVATAEVQSRTWMGEAVAHRAQEPRPEVRVRELLRWAETSEAKELFALAHMRRVRQRHHSWLHAWWSGLGRPRKDEGISRFERFWRPWMGYSLLVAALATPLAAGVDAVRWASLATISLTTLGVMLPFTALGQGVPVGVDLIVAGLLVVYAFAVYDIWWNHLLGGSRHWMRLSSRLTAELLEQADSTASVAYLTRAWAELTRRSLAQLDQELCGSWRTSLHELACKLTDLRPEAEPEVTPARQSRGFSRALTAGAATGRSAAAELALLTAQEGGTRRRSIGAAPSEPRAMLWRRVDEAVQNAARAESERMRLAVEERDPEALQAMMTWWTKPITEWSGRPAISRSVTEGEQPTLGSLLMSEQLHFRYPYPFFHGTGPDEVRDASNVALEVDTFKRLERALSNNLTCLQDLRTKLAPWEVSRTVLQWTRADAYSAYNRFQQSLRWSHGAGHLNNNPGEGGFRPKVLDDRRDKLLEFRMMSTLVVAVCASLFGAPLASRTCLWGWAASLVCFGVANTVLVLNYSRLMLPHVRRHFEERLKELSGQQSGIMQEVRALQRCSANSSLIHIKASIFLQSVNLLRNVNYLALCVKHEVQCAAAAGPAPQRQQHIVDCGLRLLLALLPHSSAQQQGYALMGGAGGQLAALLYGAPCGGRLPGGLSRREQEAMQANFAESRKRMLILFRMVHLSYELPCQVQGQLGALAERYLRPVLVERRVPLEQHATLVQGDCSQGQKALLDAAGGDGHSERDRVVRAALQDVGDPKQAQRSQSGAFWDGPDEASPAQRPPSEGGSGDEDGLSLGSFCAASSQSNASLSSSLRSGVDRRPVDNTKMLGKLVATRSDIVRVLARLPPSALLAQPDPNSKADGILNDIFSSIILLASGLNLNSAVGYGAKAEGATGSYPTVLAATGFRYGQSAYWLDRLQTSLLLEAAIPASDGRSAGGGLGGSGGVDEVVAPLSFLLEDEPSPLAAAAAWSALSVAAPTRFGDSVLKLRRRALRRAKDTLRSLGSHSAGSSGSGGSGRRQPSS